mgnify:FL=1
MRLEIKPLSVNKAWKGRRFKTDAYKSYEREVIALLRPMEVPDGELEVMLSFGFSSAASDFDNPIKPFIDCLQKRYGFDDKRIKKATVVVHRVSKGSEFIEFDLQPR